MRKSTHDWIAVGVIGAAIVVNCALSNWGGLCGWIPALWFAVRCAVLDTIIENPAEESPNV